MAELDREFLLEEYKALRQEISDSLKEVPSNERNAILVSGAFWVWFLSNGIDEAYYYVSVFIPFALSRENNANNKHYKYGQLMISVRAISLFIVVGGRLSKLGNE